MTWNHAIQIALFAATVLSGGAAVQQHGQAQQSGQRTDAMAEVLRHVTAGYEAALSEARASAAACWERCE